MRFKRWLFIASGIFIVGFGVGLVFSLVNPAGVTRVLSEQLAALKQLGITLQPFHLRMAIGIFTQNASTILLSFLLSPLLCLFPMAVLMFNGMLIAFVMVLAAQRASLLIVLLGILPHGIIEIPAVIIGEAAAISFGATALAALFSAKRRKLLVPNLKNNLKYLAISGALLVPSAVIETYITPLLLGLK